MKDNEFIHWFANLPLEKRLEVMPVTTPSGGKTLMSLMGIYTRFRELQDMVRPHVIEMERLLRAADDYKNLP